MIGNIKRREFLRASAAALLLAGGTVVVNDLENDPALQRLVAEHYGILVPESELKWRALRPSQNQLYFTQGPKARSSLGPFAARLKTCPFKPSL